MTTPHQALKVKQLLKKIDRYPAQVPTKQQILSPPAIFYQILKQVYNTYKKSNQLKILQNKIYPLKLKQYEDSHTDYSQVVGSGKKMAAVRSLLGNSNKNLSREDVESLIGIKDYLSPALKGQLVHYIVYEVEKMNDLSVVLWSYKKIFKIPECIDILKCRNQDYDGFFYFVQESMIRKILSMNLRYQKDFDDIAKFLITLPFLKNNPSLVEFIGQLFDRVNSLSDFNVLLVIFQEITNEKRNYTQKTKYLCKNNDRMKQKQFQTMCQKVKLKITIAQHLKQIKNKLQWIDNESIIDKHQLLKMMREQAKNKLKQMTQSLNYSASVLDQVNNKLLKSQQNGMDVEMNHQDVNILEEYQNFISDKHKYIFAFIFMVLEYCPDIWSQLINLHSLLSPILQHYCSLKIKLFISHPQNQHPIKTWINSVLPLLISNKQQIIISQIFLNKLMQTLHKQNKQENDRVYKCYHLLQDRRVRKFMALKIMQEQNESWWNVVADPKGKCEFVDIILQMFGFEQKCLVFFGSILQNYQKKDRFDIFLSNLRDMKAQKFKQFYQKVDQTSGGQILEFQQFHLLRYFNQIVQPYPQIAINFIRDMSEYPPSRFCVSMMLGFCRNAKSQTRSYIVSQCARTLKSILMNYSYEDLCTQFKNHLQDFHSNIPETAQFIFKYVPQEMTDKLKLYYDSRAQKI